MRLALLLILTAAVVAVPAAARAQSAPSAEAQSTYDREAVGVRRLVYPLRDGSTTDEQGHVRYDGHWDAFQGPDHHPIDDAAFFRHVGRGDLALRDHRKAIVKRSLIDGGWLLVVGALAATIAIDFPSGEAADGGSSSSRYYFNPAWGLAAAGAGLISVIAGHLLDPTPIDAEEADRLARDYDQCLRDRLGIAQTASRR